MTHKLPPMKDVKLGDKITVKLSAWQWYWLLGLLAAISPETGVGTIDDIIDQVYEVTR